MPDTDFEACPVGTMAMLESLEWSSPIFDEWTDVIIGYSCHKCGKSEKDGHSKKCKLSAILKAHRERMEPAK